jgi:hypothetical protein
MTDLNQYPILRQLREADPAITADLNWLIMPGERVRYYRGYACADGVRWAEISGSQVTDLLIQRGWRMKKT